MRTIVIPFAVFTFALCSVAESASQNAVYDHSSGRNEMLSVRAAHDETIRVTIENTCPNHFSYEYRGAFKPSEETRRNQAQGFSIPQVPFGENCAIPDDALRPLFSAVMRSSDICVSSSRNLFIPHDSQYGGYQIEIKRLDSNKNVRVVSTAGEERLIQKFRELYRDNPAVSGQGCGSKLEAAIREFKEYASDRSPEARELGDVVILTTIGAQASTIEFSGGFAINGLTNPKYAIRNDAIVRDRDAEDRESLAVAAFVHVHRPGVPYWALSLGLGIGENSKTQYYLGPSYRSSDGKWFVTAGVVWGAVERLPSGEQVGQEPSNENAIINLATRTERSGFISVSYSFLGGESMFHKPFAAAATNDSGN